MWSEKELAANLETESKPNIYEQWKNKTENSEKQPGTGLSKKEF